MADTIGPIDTRIAEFEEAVRLAQPFYLRLERLLGPRVDDPSLEDQLIPLFRFRDSWTVRIEHMYVDFEQRLNLRGRWGVRAPHPITLSLWYDGEVDKPFFGDITDGPVMELYVTSQGVYDTATGQYLANDEIERLALDLQPIFVGQTPLIRGSRFDREQEATVATGKFALKALSEEQLNESLGLESGQGLGQLSGEGLRIETKFAQLIAMLRTALDVFPDDPNAPMWRERLIKLGVHNE